MPTDFSTGQALTSSLDPPTETDTTFVVDNASGLDTDCTFRSGGPLVFDVEVTRVVGDVNADGTLQDAATLITNGVLSPTATLTLPAFDVDSDISNRPDLIAAGINPEQDIIKFNGVEVNRVDTTEPFLIGEDNAWNLTANQFSVPIEIVKFPARAPIGSTPTPAQNTNTIDIDQTNTDEVWCTAVDWAALSFKTASPIVLIRPGPDEDPVSGGDGGVFDNQGFTAILSVQGLLFDNIVLPKGDVSPNAAILNSLLPDLVKSFGVDSVHLVGISQNGLHARDYLGTYQPVNNVNSMGSETFDKREFQ